MLVKKIVPAIFAVNKDTFRKTVGEIQTMATKILKQQSSVSGMGKGAMWQNSALTVRRRTQKMIQSVILLCQQYHRPSTSTQNIEMA